MCVVPPKLKRGDLVNIIAPSESFHDKFTIEMRDTARKNIENLGLRLTFGEHVYEQYESKSAKVKHRLEDLHAAFKNPEVKAILPVMGGTTSNQLLKYIDFNLIKNNPKIVCGLSDNTALLNGITTKTDIITYYGPHYAVFGGEQCTDYTMKYFKKTFFDDQPISYKPSDSFLNSEFEKEKYKNDGMWCINPGEAEGKSTGGNLLTFNLLMGSEFMHKLDGSILFIEDNDKEKTEDFINQLQSLINQPNFERIAGVLVGRFQVNSALNRSYLNKIFKERAELDSIPVIANVDFGHTIPMITLPIGGIVKIVAGEGKNKIEIMKH